MREGDTPLSSTYIRSCVDAGDVAAAAAALGRPHRLEGVVVRGDQRGRELGFPTANLRTDAVGRGAGRRRVRRARRAPGRVGPHRRPPPLGAAAISVGTNPTFEVRQRRVEAYVLDFDGDLYGDGSASTSSPGCASMERYDAVEPLVEQMRRTSRTRQLVSPHCPERRRSVDAACSRLERGRPPWPRRHAGVGPVLR